MCARDSLPQENSPRDEIHIGSEIRLRPFMWGEFWGPRHLECDQEGGSRSWVLVQKIPRFAGKEEKGLGSRVKGRAVREPFAQAQLPVPST